jgi:hypothetical protein
LVWFHCLVDLDETHLDAAVAVDRQVLAADRLRIERSAAART